MYFYPRNLELCRKELKYKKSVMMDLHLKPQSSPSIRMLDACSLNPYKKDVVFGFFIFRLEAVK